MGRMFKSWGEVYRYYLDKIGCDHGYAAYKADIWEKRPGNKPGNKKKRPS